VTLSDAPGNEAGARFAECIDEVHERFPAAEVVVVAPGGAIVDFLMHHFDEEALWRRQPNLRHMPWCSVTELRYENEGVVLGCLADWPHGGA
jgi:broad specificity phosphatase PhoE